MRFLDQLLGRFALDTQLVWIANLFNCIPCRNKKPIVIGYRIRAISILQKLCQEIRLDPHPLWVTTAQTVINKVVKLRRLTSLMNVKIGDELIVVTRIYKFLKNISTIFVRNNKLVVSFKYTRKFFFEFCCVYIFRCQFSFQQIQPTCSKKTACFY